MTQAFQDVRWQVQRPQRLMWAQWEGEYSVFDPETGDTHLVNELPAEVLRQLAQASLTAAELAAVLADLCEVAPSPDWQGKIAGILADLADMELIDSDTP